MSLTHAFRQHLHGRSRSPKTIASYVSTVTSFLSAEHLPDDEDTSLMGVMPADVGRFLDGAPSSVQRNVQLSALRTFFSWLEDVGQIQRNPAATATRAKVQAHPREPIALDDMLKLTALVARDAPKKLRARDVCILQVFFHAALRVTEVVSLNVDQVDLQRHVIRNVVTKGNGRLTVIINDVVAEALERYMATRSELGPRDDEHALFLSQHGTRLTVRTVEEFTRRYGERAGLPLRVTPHVLRHSSATEMIDFADIRTVQEHLGHKSVTTTQRYTHVKESKHRAAVEELGRRWRRAASGNITPHGRAA